MVEFNRLIKRLSMLMAAAGMSDEDVAALLKELQSMQMDAFIEYVRMDRDRIGYRADSSHSSLIPTPTEVDNEGSRISSDAIRQIERLLTLEAGLSKVSAADALRTAFQKRHPAAYIPPFAPKDGFGRWLRSLAEAFPLGEILHIAATIRNSRVHQISDDWLKKSSE